MGSHLFRDDATVSPVTGAILLAAVSLVLASVAAVFVLGAGGRTEGTPPTANFAYEYSQVGNGNLTMMYEGGDTLDPRTIEVRADVQFRPAPGNDTGSLSGSAVGSYGLDSDAGGGDWVGKKLKASTEFTIVGDGSTLNVGSIRIVWVDPSDDRTAVLDTWQGPDA